MTGRGMGYPASRDDLVKFAEGKQASSDVLDLLREYLKLSITPLMMLPRKSNVWKVNVSDLRNQKHSEFSDQQFKVVHKYPGVIHVKDSLPMILLNTRKYVPEQMKTPESPSDRKQTCNAC